MKHSFVFTLLIYCVLQAVGKTAKTKNPAKKFYHVLSKGGGGPYDVMHVIDGSYSVTLAGHIYAKSASELTNVFYDKLSRFGPTGSRAALVKFSEVVLTETVFGFSDHSTLKEINGWTSPLTNGIANLRFDGGNGTAIGNALYEAMTHFIPPADSNPSLNSKKVWLFTDGKNNRGIEPGPLATMLKFGAQLCIVGVGPDIDEPALNTMASVLDNGDPCVFIFQSEAQYFKAIWNAVQDLSKSFAYRIKKVKLQLPQLKKRTHRKAKQAQKLAKSG